MAKRYDYVLDVWLRFKAKGEPVQLEKELREYLEEEYYPSKLKFLEPFGEDETDEFAFSLQIQMTFSESEMEDEEPTSEALDELDAQLTAYLERKYDLRYLEILDDALTSYLLNEYDDSEE